jgi:hypothetical protein
LTVNSVVFAVLMSGWEENGVRASSSMMQEMYGAALGCAVLGIVAILGTVEKSYRWTLYSTRQTPQEFTSDYFNAVPNPIFAFRTRDGQALHFLHSFHTSYLNEEAVKTFLLGLSATHPLFADDEALPTEAGLAANWTYETFYKKTLTRIKYYGPAMTAEIEQHFETMRAGIAARNERRRNLKESTKLLPQVKTEPAAPVELAETSKEEAIAALKQQHELEKKEWEGERAAWAEEREKLILIKSKND